MPEPPIQPNRVTDPMVRSVLGYRGRRFRQSALVRLTVAVVVLAGLLAGCSSKTPTSSPTGSTSSAASPSSVGITPATRSPSSTPPAKTTDTTGLSGRWKGKYSGVDQGTFVLNWTQSSSHLSGTIILSGSADAIPLTGTVHGKTITFGTVGTAAITYSGRVSGDSMAGTYRLNGSLGGPWSATRAK